MDTNDTATRAVAIVGVGAVLPDAPNAPAFWQNVKDGRYSVTEVDPARWDPALYYDADPAAPDKTYSKIGAFVRSSPWDPIAWKLPIPPRVSDAMDEGQKWAIACTREALADVGWPERPLDLERTAVILGNAMAGERHYQTSLRISFPEYARLLAAAPSFGALPAERQAAITAELQGGVSQQLPAISEDTMPGELANCIAGRIANLFNFHGPNFVVDAACASAMAAMATAVEGLLEGDYDVAVTGGIDRNMAAATYVKFCKIGALSATGTRPYADGADGFVMGEGAAIFVLKRLADAERDGDRVYAVLRGIGGASDGRGKGITAPNPVGQRLAIERAWKNAGLTPSAGLLVEGHGTSTRVGDVVEVQSLQEAFGPLGLPPCSIALGSVKSNIGHLKGAAGAAGILKAVFALRDKVLPASLHFDRPNPNIDFSRSPLQVQTTLEPWKTRNGDIRRAAVSAFGFGGTDFHAVLEEHVPGRLRAETVRRSTVAVPRTFAPGTTTLKPPLRGALVIGAASVAELGDRLATVQQAAGQGIAPAPAPPADADLRAPERLAIDYGDATELAEKAAKARKALASDHPGMWKALRAQGVFRGRGAPPKVAFLYTGQGSQYANMLRALRADEPVVAETFTEADRVMTPLLGSPLGAIIFCDPDDPQRVAAAEEDLRQTEITQPAVLATDIALTRLLAAYGISPDLVMGHSLGEYGALVAASSLSFAHALEAVSARGREMTSLSMGDNGRMAAVFAPIAEIERVLAGIDGYVVIANVNSTSQSVIGGASDAVERAIAAFQAAGRNAMAIPVSHAFHTSIVAPASVPLRATLARLGIAGPAVPVVANVTGDFYPMGPDVETSMLDLLARQVASPVQFVRGLETLYAAGARLFVEVGPKKALQGFVDDVLGDRADVVSLFTNHPKLADAVAFNQALCGFFAAGIGLATDAAVVTPREQPAPVAPASPPSVVLAAAPIPSSSDDRYRELGRLFATVLEPGRRLLGGGDAPGLPAPLVISGAALGLPGTERIFDDANLGRLLHGEQLIDVIPTRFRHAMLDKHITRLVKREAGGATFETIEHPEDVIKLAGRGGAFDLGREFGVSAERIAAFDVCTRLAIAAGIDALRDAGIPLVMHYRVTTTGSHLPEGWRLPETLRDDTGVIFASAFPGYDAFADELTRYHEDQARHALVAELEHLRARAAAAGGAHDVLVAELDRRLHEVNDTLAQHPYLFDRRFLFRVLAMGHSQFAELIGARGPNTQINSACASTTQAVALAEDWIRAGRCRRVIVVAADDATSDRLLEWIGAGFLASGAAATDEDVASAALPFDRRRHGMIVGMGAAAFVVETAEAVRERGLAPICEVLSAVTANSAFHGTRLDVTHIGGIMETLVAAAERRWALDRHAIASALLFVSHETYTPARGGSAAAEVEALRRVFGDDAARIVVANTKGLTGHPMGVGIEDVVAVKALETGLVPAVPNFKEADPELGPLTLSQGGAYPIEYALRLGAGFGSQISMSLLRRVPTRDGVRRAPADLGFQYRVIEPRVWDAWLTNVAGHAAAELEVVTHQLRVKDHGPPARVKPPVTTAAPVAPPTAPVAPAAAVLPAPQAAEVVPAPTAPTPAPSAPAAAPADAVRERILTLVEEKTGYPRDMLDVELDLEADLGVDTVKQAEMFAAIRAAYDIPRDANLKLRDFPTLRHVIQFVYDRRPDLAHSAAPAATSAPETPTAPAAAPTAAPAPSAAAPADAVHERILTLVEEKTGYPRDMLDLELDLEADLGVDTVKQAEMFAAIRAAYDIPRDANLKLRDFPTLRHVIQFVYDRRPDLAHSAAPAATSAPETPTAPAAAPTAAPAPSAAAPADAVHERILTLVEEKTGYPRDMLDLELDLEADLGVDTVKQAEMFAAIRAAYDIPRDANLKLRDFPTLRHVIQFVYDRRPDLAHSAAPAATSAPETPTAPAAAPTAAPAPSAAAPADAVHERILTLVEEKTGYPRDMLDLELDLEADLGVDTVKQAEMFAAIRAAYDIPRDANLKLRDFPTLRHVIQFVYDRRPDLRPNGDGGGSPVGGGGGRAGSVATDVANGAAAPSATPDTARRATLQDVRDADQVPRRVPVPVLRPTLARCKPTGVTLRAGRRVVVALDRGGVGKALVRRLEKRGVEVLTLREASDATALVAELERWSAKAGIHGVYWLPALDAEPALQTLDLAAWRAALALRVKSLAATMRVLYDHIATPGTFLLTATRLGGQHGYGDGPVPAPMGGAVTGFAKAYQRERPEALVKACDVGTALKPAEVADLLIEETLRDPGAVEVGYHGGDRWTVAVVAQPAIDGNAGLTLGAESVFVVTGAAGSIVAAITADLAAASGGIFHLLDRVPAPDPANPDLARFASDRDGLKRDIFERLKARGERATPALVERELAALERAHAAWSVLAAIRAAGGQATYHCVDLLDATSVARVIDTIRPHGRIDVLLHAAGLEISRTLPDKSPEEFDRVFDVKSDGWFNLLHAIGDLPLGATVAFSSIAGRFGNRGQTDYSAANDLLCKTTASFRVQRPETRGIVIDWTAWRDIGMAARGSIPQMMALAGIDMLAPAVGIPTVRRELTAGGRRGEVVVADRLGVLAEEHDADGGLEPAAIDLEAAGPMLGHILRYGLADGLVVETTLDPSRQPFLRDHQIDGTAVLPGVMGIEGFAEAALLAAPGWHIAAIENVDFLAPFKFYRGEPRTLILTAQPCAEADGELVVVCALVGSRLLAGQSTPQLTTHFTGRVRLARTAPSLGHATIPSQSQGLAVETDAIYRVYFHGPAYRVLADVHRDDGAVVGQLTDALPANHDPDTRPLQMAPRLVELCFQTAGIREIAASGRLGLPRHVDRIRVSSGCDDRAAGGFAAVITSPSAAPERVDAHVVAADGSVAVTIEGYVTVELPGGVAPAEQQAMRAVLT